MRLLAAGGCFGVFFYCFVHLLLFFLSSPPRGQKYQGGNKRCHQRAQCSLERTRPRTTPSQECLSPKAKSARAFSDDQCSFACPSIYLAIVMLIGSLRLTMNVYIWGTHCHGQSSLGLCALFQTAMPNWCRHCSSLVDALLSLRTLHFSHTTLPHYSSPAAVIALLTHSQFDSFSYSFSMSHTFFSIVCYGDQWPPLFVCLCVHFDDTNLGRR